MDTRVKDYAADNQNLIDPFGRRVEYLRVSVTDRCDFRCIYCMAEDMQFVPRREVLTLEEIYTLVAEFTRLGVRKVRLTGGEPLVRRNIVSLVQDLARLEQLQHLAMTTNGSQLESLAGELRDSGLNSINISLDTLDRERFRKMTRVGDLDQVLRGVDAAREAGFERIKLNAVILNGYNEDEILPLLGFAIDKELDITFIEEMPLGEMEDHNRQLSYCSSETVKAAVDQQYALRSLGDPVGDAGPSRYYAIDGTASRVGFISPHSHNFCHLCNRVRLTVEGRLLLCLGNEHSADLRDILRSDATKPAHIRQAIRQAMLLKPERHHFDLEDEPQILRFMNTTGG